MLPWREGEPGIAKFQRASINWITRYRVIKKSSPQLYQDFSPRRSPTDPWIRKNANTSFFSSFFFHRVRMTSFFREFAFLRSVSLNRDQSGSYRGSTMMWRHEQIKILHISLCDACPFRIYYLTGIPSYGTISRGERRKIRSFFYCKKPVQVCRYLIISSDEYPLLNWPIKSKRVLMILPSPRPSNNSGKLLRGEGTGWESW